MKYYALTFNEDWADEHNIPALAVMNQDEYFTWLNASLTEGKDSKEYLEAKALKEELMDDAKRYMYMRIDKTIPEEELNEIRSKERSNREAANNIHLYNYEKAYPAVHGCFGNHEVTIGQDLLDEGHRECSSLVERELVNVTEITEDFYNTFNKLGLSNLSMCNLFDLK